MEPVKVGIREFRERLAAYLLESDAPAAKGITEDELKARMKALDGADGQGDGRAVSAPHRCAKCGAMVPPGMDRCQFCGARDDAASAFG